MTRRRILLLLLSLVALLLGGTYVVLRHTGAAHALISGLLRQVIRSPFALGETTVDPASGRVRMQGLRIESPGQDPESVLTAARVEIDVNTNPLGEGEVGGVRRVRVENLDLQIDLAAGAAWRWGDILQLPDSDRSEPAAFPAVEIVDSRLSVHIDADADPLVFRDVQLEIRPDAEDDSQLVVSGRMTSPGGFEVTVRGSGSPNEQRFRVLLESQDVPLGPAAARPYGDRLAQLLETEAFRARARKVAVWLQFPPEADDTMAVTARLAADLDGVSFTPERVPYPIEDAVGTVTASTRNGGSVQCSLTAHPGTSTIEARAEVRECFSDQARLEGRLLLREIPLDGQLAKALGVLPEPRDVWNALRPGGGRASADIHVATDLVDPRVSFSMDLDLHGVTASFHGFQTSDGDGVRFPYELQDVSGRVRLRGGDVVIEKIEGTRRDGGTVRLRGEVLGLDQPVQQQVITLAIDGAGVAFSRELRDAVDAAIEDGGTIYDRFTPVGRGNVEVRVRKTRDATTAVEVRILPQGCTITCADFPYRIDAVTGTIDIAPDHVRFDVTGRRDDSTIDVGGRFMLHDRMAGLRSELRVTAAGVVLDAELRRAMGTVSPELDLPWARFDPTGTVDCTLSLWQPATSERFEHDLRLDFRTGSIGVEQLPRRIQELAGTVFSHGRDGNIHFDISMLHGTVGDPQTSARPARVTLQGSIDNDGGEDSIDLLAMIHELDLDRELAGTLERLGVLDIDTWAVLAPSGHVDVMHRRSTAEDGEPSHSTRVLLRDVRSDAAFLPAPVTGLRGELVFENGQATFEEVRGRLGEAEVVCRDGSFGSREDHTFVDVSLSSDHVEVDASFANLMTGPIRETFLARGVRGPVKINALHMHYQFPDGGGPLRLTVEQGEILTKGIRMELFAPLRDIRGILRVEDGQITPDGGSVRCAMRGISFMVLQHRCHELHANLTATPEAITFSNLGLRVHGGEVTGTDNGTALAYSLVGDGNVSCGLRWQGVSLREFLRASGQQTPASRGTVSGTLRVDKLAGGDLFGAEAACNLQIRNGKLGEVPIFSAIYSFLTPKNRPQFDGVDLSFRLQKEQIVIDEVTVTSQLIKVVGSGTVDLDGYLDIVLEFPDFFASAAEWLILPAVLKEINATLVRFHVHGFLRKPRARPRWLFQSDPERIPIGPIPSSIPARPRKNY